MLPGYPGLRAPASLKRVRLSVVESAHVKLSGASRPGLIEAFWRRSSVGAQASLSGASRPGLIEAGIHAAGAALDIGKLSGASRPGLIEAVYSRSAL